MQDLTFYLNIYNKEHLRNKMSYSEIQSKYNIPRGTWDYYVRKKLKLKCDKRKTKINDTFFDIIDSEIKAYILGFLYADGYLASDGRIGIRLQYLDIEVLKLIQKYICPDRPIEHTNNQNIKRKPQVSLRFCSEHIYNRLKKLGFCVKKTTTPSNIFKYIPDNFKIAFIRGFTDGDGCLSLSKAKDGNYYKVSLSYTSGTSEILKDIRDYFKCGNLKQSNTKTFYHLRYDKRTEAIKIMTLLYQNSSIYLSRKYKRYLEIKKLYPNTELT